MRLRNEFVKKWAEIFFSSPVKITALKAPAQACVGFKSDNRMIHDRLIEED
jgi:hypothetical protein